MWVTESAGYLHAKPFPMGNVFPNQLVPDLIPHGCWSDRTKLKQKYRTAVDFSSEYLQGWFTFLSWPSEALYLCVFDTIGALIAAQSISYLLSFFRVCPS